MHRKEEMFCIDDFAGFGASGHLKGRNRERLV